MLKRAFAAGRGMTASSFDDRFGELSKFDRAISDQSTLGEVLITATFIKEQLGRSKLKPLCWAIGRTEPGDYDGYQIFHLAAQRTIMQLLNRADHAMAECRRAKVWPVERTDYDPDPDYDPRDYIY